MDGWESRHYTASPRASRISDFHFGPYNGGMEPAPLSFAALDPDLVLDALDSLGLHGDGRLLALNSYENRVYQVGMEQGPPLVTTPEPPPPGVVTTVPRPLPERVTPASRPTVGNRLARCSRTSERACR